jgi:hypothetical protein
MAKKRRHVVFIDGKWRVRRAGAARASRSFATQEEAIEEARLLARKEQSEVYIHGRDGRIRERSTYGRDRSPPKG